MLGPILRGTLIELHPAESSDLETFRHWFADTEVTARLATSFVPSEQGEQEWYRHTAEASNMVHWAIRADDRLVGATSLDAIDWLNRQALSGMLLGDRTVWGRGYATEAVRLRTAYAFDTLGLHRLETFSFADNIGMHRALERAGYRPLGRRRESYFRRGGWHDVVIFELLRDDWLALRGNRDAE